MNKNLIFSVLAVLFLVNISVFAQNVEFTSKNFPNDKVGLKEAQKNLSEGNKLFSKGPRNYAAAIDFFIKANNFNPNNAVLNYRLGKCLFFIDKQRAIPHLEKAQELKPNMERDILYLTAQSYHGVPCRI